MLFLDGEDTRDERGIPLSAFWNAVGNWRVGEEFHAFGYPTEGPTGESTQAPTTRMFTGHFQRFMPHVTPHGYRFLAGEMSIPSPVGLSGGPLFRPRAHQMVLGVAAGNVDTYSVLDSILDVDDAGKEYRVRNVRVIRYGVAVMLSEVTDWLDEQVPPLF
jgi:hypothetical protein